MLLSEIKQYLTNVEGVSFQLPSGAFVPEHFHVTEVGAITRHFIDCGGKERMDKVVNFQLWDANDYEHRLKPQKLLNIIALAERKLGLGDWTIEVEYQGDTIGKYELGFDGTNFLLLNKQTACLAKEACGIPAPVAGNAQACCTPSGGCC